MSKQTERGFVVGNAAATPPTGIITLYAKSTGLLYSKDSAGLETQLGTGGVAPGTVTDVSIVSANGLAGTVANSATTPAITLSTTITGILKGNATAISAASAGDFPTLNQNTSGTASNVSGVIALANGGTGQTSLATASIATYTGIEILTNKRITSRVQSVTDAATVTPAGDTNDAVDITAIAQAFTIANPSGTPTNFQKLIIRIKDNGTARAISFGTAYVAGGVTLPSTTILSKILTLGFMYNTANTLNKWQLIASSQES